MSANKIQRIYEQLLNVHGPQGWWPLLEVKGTNPTKTGSINGYHPADYSYPKNEQQRFEIIIGAILTQNTAWPNVEKALMNLKKVTKFTPQALLQLPLTTLKKAIKPAGYFNQKAVYLKNIAEFFKNKSSPPSRSDLLKVKGVGSETADSILLYAFKQPEFVIDAYTRRIFSSLNIIKKKDSYEKIKQLFQKNLKKDFKIYQEYHALIVEHAKNTISLE